MKKWTFNCSQYLYYKDSLNPATISYTNDKNENVFIFPPQNLPTPCISTYFLTFLLLQWRTYPSSRGPQMHSCTRSFPPSTPCLFQSTLAPIPGISSSFSPFPVSLPSAYKQAAYSSVLLQKIIQIDIPWPHAVLCRKVCYTHQVRKSQACHQTLFPPCPPLTQHHLC